MRAAILIILASMVVGCGHADRGLITSDERLDKIAARLSERSSWLPSLKGQSGSLSEKQALDFLYAYMPIGDVADYEVRFYRANIGATLAARSQMPWGSIVPEAEFLHFVLPVRVNNENMDTSRMVFFRELKDRVKGLSMKDAIMEVNHWCHEKATYTPTDARTISPLGIVKNGAGRCGEQSTFTVAALRSVGIPARQIYVPRWAHTDDNHAWVEAWAASNDGTDGKWYYLGACEPEPVLNTGWFDAPAKRSLLMITKAFGDYMGSEEVLGLKDSYTELNVTSNYAPTRRITVQVVDSVGRAVPDARVIFSIYNYASHYPAVDVASDSMGMASLSAGMGDMLVWASKDGMIANNRGDFRTADTVRLVLGGLATKSVDWDLVPPAEGVVEVVVTDQARNANNLRFAAQDSIREAYLATFMTRTKSDEIAAEIGADADRVWSVMNTSRGNHDQISLFLINTPPEQAPIALDLLEVISTKDLHDISSDVLLDHLQGAANFAGRPHFKESILNPRIDNELITPYRSMLSATTHATTAEQLIAIANQIAVKNQLNPAGIPITVAGVHKLKMADSKAAERYTIALLRSKGIAARREPITEQLQYFKGDKWVNINVENVEQKGTLKVNYNKTSLNDDPKLNTHFSIARWNGTQYGPLDLDALTLDMGAGVSYNMLFNQPIELPVGNYMLTTGTRLSSGTVLARDEPFVIVADKPTVVEMVMRSTDNALQVIDELNAEQTYLPRGESEVATLLSQTGRGYFVLAMVDVETEPTIQLLRDLSQQKAQLEQWGRPIVLVFGNKAQLAAFNVSDFAALPSNVIFGADVDGRMSAMLGTMLDIKDMSRLPVVAVADTFGRVFYVSTGHNTSLGEHLSVIIENL